MQERSCSPALSLPEIQPLLAKRQSRENPTPHAYPEARREEMLSAYQERSSVRGLTRILK